MKKFMRHRGVAAPLLRDNVDTDAIIPSREMKRVSRQGLGEGLFAGWRYTLPGDRDPNPSFVLNREEYAGASILLCGDNFGCGSSREHAVWALQEFGIRALVAPSFGSIFYRNCIRNGILPVVLDRAAVEGLALWVQSDPRHNVLLIDLPAQSLTGADSYHFELEPGLKQMLLEGLDAISLTLQHEADIADFEARDQRRRPWIY